ncbi:MAG: TIGR00730 family Rossman fold protein [Hyphomicrobiaceae bacterium]
MSKTQSPDQHAKATQPTRSKRVPERAICVFCGSGPGINPAYVEAAKTLGQAMAEADIGLVYGGGSLGLMGEVARAVLVHGGHVTGIIPAFLSEKERMLRDVDELVVTDDMHERKRLMFERSDAFVALPGGIGTLEELIEQLTWAQLGRHDKPIVLADIARFWHPLKALIEHMRAEAFIRQGLEVRYQVVSSAEEIVPLIVKAFEAGAGRKTDPGLAERF